MGLALVVWCQTNTGEFAGFSGRSGMRETCTGCSIRGRISAMTAAGPAMSAGHNAWLAGILCGSAMIGCVAQGQPGELRSWAGVCLLSSSCRASHRAERGRYNRGLFSREPGKLSTSNR